MAPQVVWTIAGFDPSSGAGITADLMTFAAHGLFGCSAITALTVQSTLGVAASEAVRPELLRQTLEHLAADLPPTGVKIGMLGTPQNAHTIAVFLRGFRERTASLKVVLDPVLRSSSGRELYPTSALSSLCEQLLPLVDFITPNWTELGVLAEAPVLDLVDAEAAARSLIVRHPQLNVVATGGDQVQPTDLLVTTAGERFEVAGEHIRTNATHGTGCAFSSALLANLSLGAEPEHAVQEAKRFVTGALRHAPGLGHGKGPLGLLWSRGKTD